VHLWQSQLYPADFLLQPDTTICSNQPQLCKWRSRLPMDTKYRTERPKKSKPSHTNRNNNLYSHNTKCSRLSQDTTTISVWTHSEFYFYYYTTLKISSYFI
jgi:hypothetical protein